MDSNKINFLIVGGAVRDMFLGRTPSDIDYMVICESPDYFLTQFPQAISVGKTYPVFYLNNSEFSFPRNGGQTLEEQIDNDLKSRDFTINSMAIDENGELYCHQSALRDITEKVLRPSSSTAISEDPLRIFRAASFYSRFPDFKISTELLTQINQESQKEELKKLSGERIGVELRKALSGNKPGNFIRMLYKSECLNYWFEELLILKEDTKPNQISLINQTADLMDYFNWNSLFSFGALCYNLSLFFSTTFLDSGIDTYFVKKINPIQKLGKRLRLPNKYILYGEISHNYLPVAVNYEKINNQNKVNLLIKAHNTGTLEMLRQFSYKLKGYDVMASAESDLKKILKIKLPKKDMNMGIESGKKLNQLRITALNSE